jgi:hypothetical protein
MNWELLFKLANASVIPAWLLLIFLPKNRLTDLVVHSAVYPILLGLVYTILMVVSFGGDGGMDSLENLKLSFSRNEVLLLGWVHYLVFDLFIGAWIVRDAIQTQITHLKVIPSLILTLFAGPIGLLSYLMIRGIIRKRLTL